MRQKFIQSKINSFYKARRQTILIGVILLLVLFSMNFVNSSWNESFNINLVGHWKLDNTLEDDYIYNNDLTGNYTWSYALSKINNGVNLSYGDNGILLDLNKKIDLKGNFTLSFWMQQTGPTTANYYPIFGNGAFWQGLKGFMLGFDSNTWCGSNLCFFGNTGAGQSVLVKTTNALNETFNFVVLTRNITGIYIYVNNILAGKNESSYSQINLSNENIPSFGGYDYLGDPKRNAMIIDEIGYWNKSLNVNELSYLYNYTEKGININLVSPVDNYITSSSTIYFLSNATITSGNFTNATLYVWYANTSLYKTNYTAKTGDINSTNLSLSLIGIGNYNWNVLWCGNNGTASTYNCSYSSNNRTFSLGSIIQSSWYSNTTYETSSENFNLTLEVLTGSEISIAQLVYNGTNYTISDITGNATIKTFKKTINIPLNINPFANETKQFFWRFIYAGSSLQETEMQNQTVSFINFQLCNSTYNIKYLNFTVKDEKTKVNINSSFSGIFNYYLGNGGIYKNYSYSNISNLNYFYNFCFYPQDKTIKTNMISEFNGDIYQTRTYYLINASLTNVTNNINLYLLNDSSIIKFFFTLTKSLTPIANAYVTISKYDLSTGTYNTISIRKSDAVGKFIEYLELDKDYRFLIVKNSELLGILDKDSICSVTPCEIFLEITEEIVDLWQGYYDNFATNIAYNLTFNPVSNVFTFDFIDLTGLANYFRLQVNKIEYNQTGALICNNFSYSNSGILICNVTGYEGNFIARAYINRSPEKLIETIYGFINALRNMIGPNEGLLFTFILIFLVALIGAWNPVVGIILAASTFFLSFMIGFVSVSYTTIILIFILAVVIILKTGREV